MRRPVARGRVSLQGIVLYSEYSRKDDCKLLNLENEEASTLYGYKSQYKTTPWACPIFGTYNKSDGEGKDF